MDYAVVRWTSFTDDEVKQECFLMAQYNTLWEAERACRMFRESHPTTMFGEAVFAVVHRQRNVCQQTVGGSE
jgi:hypothetical protein